MFIENSRNKRDKPEYDYYSPKSYSINQNYISPKSYLSPKRFPNSPQLGSPKNTILDATNLSSSQLLVSNLKSIQKFHKEKLQIRAKN